MWAQLTGALGVPADAAPGDRIAASAGAGTALSGTVPIAARDEPAWQAWLRAQFTAG